MRRLLSCIAAAAVSMTLAGCSSSIKGDNTSDIEINTDENNYEDNMNSESEACETSNENSDSDEITNEEETIDSQEGDISGNENSNNSQEKKPDENSKKVIVIDPGHASRSNLEKEEQSPGTGIMKIKDGGGAQGDTTGTPEYVVNMSVAMKLKNLLESENYTVIMTKTSNDISIGNIERANIGNDNNAALVIRIHCDSAENPSAKGASMLVPAKTGYANDIADISRKYGETVLNSLVETVQMNNRGISVRDDMTGFNWSKVPVILVEMGFMSNPEEDKLLSDDNYQNKLAQGLCNGIVKCFE
ncbi:MAG: N-acetylmuramoyl-L-alanine amidase [Clostridium sp.]